MALVRNCSDQKLMRRKAAAMVAQSKPFLLKDYLMDDMSSCSSNGFKSYPRRQCCSTVRFLVDVDRKARDRRPNNRSKPPVVAAALKRSRSRAAAATTMSALQRATVAVLNAVKLLPFHSVKSPSSVSTTKKAILPRSFSRKLLKRSFWKKNCKEEPDRRCRLFRELLEEKEKPSDENTQHSTTSTNTTTITASRLSTSTSSYSNSNSNSTNNSFAECEFSPDTLQSTSSYRRTAGGDDVVEGETDSQKVSKRVGVTVGQDSMEAAKEVWQNHEEKEQFSPVSVLDCPFEDDEEEDESSSSFQHSISRVEGTKQKLMHKIRRFESLADQLEPTDLEKRIALSQLEEQQHEPPMQHRTSISTNTKVNANEQDYKTEQELEKLLKKVKPASTLKFMADNLLLDFFRERLQQDNALFEQELLSEARDWVNGSTRELVLGWEVQEGRKMYVKDMEKSGRWREMKTTSLEEKQEVAVDLETMVWTSLVNELVLDLF